MALEFGSHAVTRKRLMAPFNTSYTNGDLLEVTKQAAELAEAVGSAVARKSPETRRAVAGAMAEVLNYCNLAVRMWNGVSEVRFGDGKRHGVPMAAFGADRKPAFFNRSYIANAGCNTENIRDKFVDGKKELLARPDINHLIFKTKKEADRATKMVVSLMGNTERYAALFGPYGSPEEPNKPGNYMVSNTIKVKMADGIGSVRIFLDATEDLKEKARRELLKTYPELIALRDDSDTEKKTKKEKLALLVEAKYEELSEPEKARPLEIIDPEKAEFHGDGLGFFSALERLRKELESALGEGAAENNDDIAERMQIANAAAMVAETAWTYGMYSMRVQFGEGGPVRFNPAMVQSFEDDAETMRQLEAKGLYLDRYYTETDKALIQAWGAMIKKHGYYDGAEHGTTFGILRGGRQDPDSRRSLSWLRADLRHENVVQPSSPIDYRNGCTKNQVAKLLAFGVTPDEADRLTVGECRMGKVFDFNLRGTVLPDGRKG